MIQAPIISVRNSHLQNSSSEWSGKHKIHPNSTENETTATNEQPVKPRPYALKSKSFAGIKFVPKLGHALEDWIDLPVDHDKKTNIIFNSVTLPFKWLLWTSKALAGLPPHQSLRERLCNQSASLGSVAGLFLVIAISAYFIPPTASTDLDKILVNVYGILMYFSAMALTIYICLSLTVMYPLLESIPDFAAMEAYQNLAERWGGYELFLFNLGCQSVLLAMMVTAKVVYGWTVLYVILGIFAVLYSFAAFMTREFFIAIDPITTVHMGICNAPQTIARARALVTAIKNRHEEFMNDSDNEEEYVATHYMEPNARKIIAQHRAAARLGSLPAHNSHNHGNSHGGNQNGAGVLSNVASAGTGIGVRGGDSRNEPQSHEDANTESHNAPERMATVDENEQTYKTKYHVNTHQQYTTAEANGTNGERESEMKAEEPPQQRNNHSEVTDFHFSERDVVPTSTSAATTSIPTLQAILLGENCLLRSARGSTMTTTDCENVYNILVKQGCRSTQHLISLLQWHCTGGAALQDNTVGGVSGNGRDRLKMVSLDTGRCFKACVTLGIPAFHAMDLISYLKSHVH